MTTELFPYQRKGVRKITHFHGRALLADEMGLGKTLQVLTYAKQEKFGCSVIVCPAGLKFNWQREAAIHLGVHAEVLEGTRPPRHRFPTTYPLYVVNYDILGPWMSFLQGLAPDLVALDECHMIKNRGSLRYKHVAELVQDVPAVIGISGTPLTNRPAELWPILNILRPDIYPSFFAFAVEHCKPQRKRWGWEYKGAAKLPELHANLLTSCMIRRRKADVLGELPAKQRFVVPLDIEDRKQYQEAKDNFRTWMGKHHRGKMDKVAAAEALMRLGYLKRLAGTLKLPSTIEWVEQWLAETDEKMILFGIHKAVLLPIFEKWKDKAVLITGDVAAHKRQLAVDKFTNDKKTRLVVANIQAGGVGWNGTAATTVAFAEMGWTPGEHTQAEDRPHRIGQKGNVRAYYLVAHSTIEERLCELIQEKQRNLDTTLDGTPNTTDLQIFDQLIKELSH